MIQTNGWLKLGAQTQIRSCVPPRGYPILLSLEPPIPRLQVAAMESSVLVLNQNYEPLNVCNARRAFILLDRGKAEVIEHGHGALHSASLTFVLPSVIRMMYAIRRPRPQVRLTRREVFQRDRYMCQYCGRQGKDMTLDHVLPRHRGGKHT